MIVETLDRRGNVVARIAVTGFPVRIGRAYDNDVILTDPRVDAHHAVIHRVGDRWRFDDQHSANGSQLAARSIASEFIASGGEVRVGRTTLRFMAEDHPVAAAQRDPAFTDAVARTLRSPLACIAICLGAVTVVGAMDYLGRYDDVSWQESASVALIALLVVGLWAGPWAFASRSFTHESRFLAHAAIACAVLTASTAIDIAGAYLGFFFLPGETTSRIADFAVTALVVGGLLFAHLSLFSQTALRPRLLGVALLTLFTLGVFEFASFSDEEIYVGQPEFPAELKPLDAAWLPAETSERFFADLDSLRDRVEELAEEAEKQGEPGA